jgi:putative FmdB family regulatory protein
MPLYEYYCPKCASTYELLRPMRRSEEPGTCPKGHANGARTITAFASVAKGEAGAYAPMRSGGLPGDASSGCGCGGGGCGCGR